MSEREGASEMMASLLLEMVHEERYARAASLVLELATAHLAVLHPHRDGWTRR